MCLALIFLVNASCFVYAQTDSLKQLLKTAREDTNKVTILNKLSWELLMTGNYDTSLQYANSARALALKLGFKKGLAASYNSIGLVSYNQGNYPAALENHSAALKIKGEMGDKKGMASSYGNLGLVYFSQGNLPAALRNNLLALKTFEETGFKNGVALAYINIGNVYKKQNDFRKALENYFSALKVKEEIGDRPGMADIYNNLGLIYSEQGNYTKALENHEVALKIRKEMDDKMGLAGSYTNIGNIYFGNNKLQEALSSYSTSLKIEEQMGDKEGIAFSYYNIGGIFLTMGKAAESRKWFEKGLNISKEIGSPDAIKDNYSGLAEADSILGRYKEAFFDYKQYIVYRDRLLNEENTKKTVEAQMQYEFDKKETATKLEQEKKDAVTASEKRRQQIIIISTGIGLFLVLIIAGVILRSLRLNQKQNKIITGQKELVEKQKHLVEEKHKEITDSINYAERIQHSFLASRQLLDDQLRDYFVLFQPKDVVSGDFYWAGKLQNGRFALATADSTGHGVPGAIMSILNISSLEKAVEQGLNEPADILNHTRVTIISRLKKDGSAEGGKDGMDCSLISFDLKNKMLTYAAANNPVWIVREKEMLEFAPDKMPVGKHDKDSVSFTQHVVSLQKGDVVYALTDGLPDQFGGPKGKKFMYKQLKELLISIAHLPVQEQKDRIANALNSWKGNLEQVDDVTLIGVRV